ncbi:MAG: hypothetical protein WC319_11000 [Candidatus Paceibacterota bacterium]|jgi:hypothetical protein
MNKISKIIILSVLTLILIVTGYLLYDKWLESKMGLVSFENVSEEQVDGKRYIENKEVGLRFAIPEGWEVQKDDMGLSMHSSDFVPVEKNDLLPQSGCSVVVNSDRQEKNSDYDRQYSSLERNISNENLLADNSETSKKEIIELAGLKGIRHEFYMANSFNVQGNVISILIPYNEVIYSFETYFFGEDKESCLREFNNFLTTVTIKK